MGLSRREVRPCRARDAETAKSLTFSFTAETPANEHGAAAPRGSFLKPRLSRRIKKIFPFVSSEALGGELFAESRLHHISKRSDPEVEYFKSKPNTRKATKAGWQNQRKGQKGFIVPCIRGYKWSHTFSGARFVS